MANLSLTSSTNPFLYVTHIEKQGSFIKVWGQTDRSSPLIVKKVLLQVALQFDQGLCIPTFENLHTGNIIYCAKWGDGVYYRIKINNILVQQNLAEVHFIDFGNREVISIVNIRLVPNTASGLITIAPLAKEFILGNVTHHGSVWEPTVFSLICNELRFCELTYSIIGQFGTYVLVKLFKNLTEDFALSLFNRGIVLSIALNAQHMILQNVGPSAMSSPMPSVLERQATPPMPVARAPQTPVAQPPQQALLTYKGAVIEPGNEYNVYVSYVCDGPCQFSIQLQKAEDNLARLMKDLNTMTLQPLEDFPMPGTVCVARCVEDDHICRAVVTNMVDSQYKVFYVDFGNSEVVPIDNIFQIPFKYVIPKVMATRYALAGLDKSSVTVQMKCAFKDFVCDKLLRMQALPAPARSTLPLCNLLDEHNVNVLDVIQQFASLAYPEVIQLTRGSNQEVHVSYVHSCSRFYVQLKGKEAELSNLMENLQQVCGTSPGLQEISIGLPCCALYVDDGQWYRAQVIKINGNEITVRYVDFGNESIVAINCLVKPPSSIITMLKPQAIECCLHGYQNMEDDLERDNILEQIILENNYTMKVIEKQSNRILVELIEGQSNMGKQLLERLAASKSQVSPILKPENHQFEQRKSDERKPLREQNERQIEKQDSWRQQKIPRKDEDDKNNGFDTTPKSWRDNTNNTKTDSFNASNKDSFNKPNRDNFERRPRKDTEDNSNSNWKSNRDGFKKDSWDQGGDSNYKPKSRDGFKNDTWEQNGDYKQKSNDEGGWDNQRQNNRYNKSNDDNRKPRGDYKQSGGNRDNWGSSNTVVENKVTDPAPFTTAFSSPDVLNRTEKVIISWFHDPLHFYCQLFDKQTEFKTMMEDIQNHYCNIKPDSAPVGSSVIAQFPDDSVLYRATVLEATGSQYRVQYIDFGNISMTNKVWPVENKFMKLARQALHCGLNGIMPVGDAWPNAASFSSYFDKEYFYCQFVSFDDVKYDVELHSDGITSVSEGLISNGLAQYAVVDAFDPSILLGQQIKVIVRSVDALDSFNVELPNGTLLLCTLHNLSSAVETFEDMLKQCLDNFVIVYVDNVLEDRLEVTVYDTAGNKYKIIEPDEGAFETVEIPCSLPILYGTVTGCVSHVQLEGEIWNVFIQPVEHADPLAILLENLFNHYEGSEEAIEPEVGLLYAIHSTDTNWYRGEVKSIEDDNATVTFIDYGNSETVNKSELRSLTEEFLGQHILVLQVTAAGVDDSFIEQNVTGTIWYGDNGWEGELQIQASEEVAAVEEQPIPVEETGVVQPLTAIECVVEATEHVETTERVVETIEPPEEIPNPPQQIGVSVILSHTDSPTEFYLQQSESLDTIENLQAALQEQVLEFPNLENPAAGSLCAAPYSLDLQWYRAQILDADEDITTVRFVDYGNTDVITNSTTSVKTLPPELLSLEQYARRSSLMLECIGSEWSTAAYERFEQLTNVDYLSAEIIHQDEKTTFVQLYANGINVGDVLLQEGLANKLQLETESSCTGYVSNLNSPSEFWIQLENSVADLEWIAEQLSAADGFLELDDLTPGSLCAALFPDDEMWYRARILSNTVAGIEVLFIDYGNSCTCISLRQLPEDLIMLAPLAQKCSLQKPPGILQWGPQANKEFKTISADGATIFNIDKVSTGETYIVRLLLDGVDISEKLKPVTESFYLSCLESVSKFWLHRAGIDTKLQFIHESLNSEFDWQIAKQDLGSEYFVGALRADDCTWLRGQVLKRDDETGSEVYLVDYGGTIIASKIREIPIKLDERNEPGLALECRLEPLPGYKFGDSASETLKKLIESEPLEVEILDGGLVRIYLNGSDVRLKLESIPITSAQNSPKKIVSTNVASSFEEGESRETAESIVDVVQSSVSEALPDMDSEQVMDSIMINNADYLHNEVVGNENKSESTTTAASILAEIEHSVNNHIEKLGDDVTQVENGDTQCNNKDGVPEITSVKVTQQSNKIDDSLSSETSPNGVETNTFEESLNVETNKTVEEYSDLQNHEENISGQSENSEAFIHNRRLSTTHSEKVVAGFYNCHEHFEHSKQQNDTEDALLDKSRQPLDVVLNTDTTKNNTLSSCTDVTPLTHSDKIVAGCFSNCDLFENLEASEVDDCSILKAELENTKSDYLTEFSCISNENLKQRRSTTPYAEKIVPGSICHGDLNNLLANCNENHTDVDTIAKNRNPFEELVSSSNDTIGNFIEPRTFTPHAEKIVPGSVCRGDLDTSCYEDFNETREDSDIIHVDTDSCDDIRTISKSVVGLNEILGMIQRRPTSHNEKIVPGSICHGDFDNTIENHDSQDEPDESITDNSKEYNLTEEISSKAETEVLGVVEVSTRNSLPYPEKIVPGSICRGDLSTVEASSDDSQSNDQTHPEDILESSEKSQDAMSNINIEVL